MGAKLFSRTPKLRNKVILKELFGLCENAWRILEWDCAYKITRISAATYPKKVSKIRNYHNHKLQTHPRHGCPTLLNLVPLLKLRNTPLIHLSNMQIRYA